MYTITKRATGQYVCRTRRPIQQMIEWLGGNATLKDVMEHFVITKERLWVAGE